MRIHRIRNYAEFIEHKENNKSLLEQHTAFYDSFLPKQECVFHVPGYSYTAGKHVDFIVDYQHTGGSGQVNWRESVCCPETYYNNRMRATIQLFDTELGAYPHSKIYLTEQITPIFDYFNDRFDSVVGSEFLGDSVPLGGINKKGVRNENLCDLSFADESFDFIISLDVIEHIPDYEQAFKECARVIKPGGKMMWSVPFVADWDKNVIRAEIVDGEIHHILPPEYHGDPLSSDGVLCFQHFGWEMFEQAKKAGFKDAYAMCYHSKEFGYLGSEQYMFVAIK